MKKKNLLKNDAVQSLLASLGCIVFGLLVGYVVLLFIQPKGAGKAILTIIENFFTYNRAETQMKYLGSTLVKTAPLLMCSLSILFAYKVGLFNIGAAGQYVVGACTRRLRGAGAGCRACSSPSRPAWPPVRSSACSRRSAMSTKSSPASCSTGSSCTPPT